jgi:hypothetical protein
MLNLARVIKPWMESAALNDHINLYGFWDDTTFLTKSDLSRLEQGVRAFSRQLGDFVEIRALQQAGQFTFFRRLLNYDDGRIAGNHSARNFSIIRWSTLISRRRGIIFVSVATSCVCSR